MTFELNDMTFRKSILYNNFKIFRSLCISYVDLGIILGKHPKEIRDIHNDLYTKVSVIALFLKAKKMNDLIFNNKKLDE